MNRTIYFNELAVEFLVGNKIIHQDFDSILKNFQTDQDLTSLAGVVLIEHVSFENEDQFIKVLMNKDLSELSKLHVIVDEIQFNRIVAGLAIVEAAGGLVENSNKELLMIKRLGKWDLPKGKIEKGEGKEEGALREVEEECSVEVESEGYFDTTWHTYFDRKGKACLKPTYWYEMSCLNDKKMAPQLIEDIEEVKWVSSAELEDKMQDTYASLRELLKKYIEKNTSNN
ncbi:NUDIX hydrolase [Aureibacter tunicatorum]|uniref:ADP-ribose pyrophosphatase YjhB (NUDIX family) n=1 Tax=Aureibacter tunicatorum TaxID=866807 RepID=A0AAE4BR47_9BACT|nr:NUDIX domain-containing protein [Aureibacter tunicatorum]MDR6238286.1 ADP-ribose pyrophosphatase YjhB (NUDIX family) [Aureibacter tunicatorum]BDD03319.1 hypothetical protein AUTU_08020 [Aureibacter tunicatorum]